MKEFYKILMTDKICVFNLSTGKERKYDSITKAHMNNAKPFSLQQIRSAMEKKKRIGMFVFYPESWSDEIKAKIPEFKRQANEEKSKPCVKVEKPAKKVVTEKSKKCVDTSRPCAIVIYDLETMERKVYSSASCASAKLGIDKCKMLKSIASLNPADGRYLATSKDKEKEAKRMLAYHKSVYDRKFRKSSDKQKPKTRCDEQVWLRIDAKTEILVEKENATQEYAEWFRYKMNNPKPLPFSQWKKESAKHDKN